MPPDAAVPDLRLVPYGRPAAQALREAIDHHKGGDPLAPVTVVVPSNFVGLSMRRLLASGDLGPIAGSAGLGNVRFQTLFGVAGLLGTTRLAREQRAPLSSPVLVSTIRRVLNANAGLFSPVLDHPTTERALAGAYADLSEASAPTLARLAEQSERAAEVVRVVRSARALLTDWHDERELLEAARLELGEHPALADELGPVVVYLPGELAPSALALLQQLCDRVPVTVVAALTGAPAVDTPVRDTLAALGLTLPPGPASVPPVPDLAGTRIISAPDTDEEVRTALREVLTRVDAGARLDRMAVLYPARHPYLLTLHEQLVAAGIPFNGPSAQSLGETIVGRTLLGLLALPDHDFRRDDVSALLAAGPLRQGDGQPINATRWDRVSRQAGVVSLPDGWSRRLGDYIERVQGILDDPAADLSEGGRAALEGDIQAASNLWTFVAQLVDDLDPEQLPRDWAGRAEWAKNLLRRYLGDVRLRAWPEHEQQAMERIDGVLDRLAALDGVDPEPAPRAFRQMLEFELEVPARRHGRFGEGLLVSSIHLAPGLDLDTVVVLGLAEGTFPARTRDDVLVPDHEREAATADRRELPLRGRGVVDDQRAMLAALASAPDRLLLFPRGDARRGRERLPSRWLLDVASRLGDARVGTESFDAWAHDHPAALVVDSFVDGVRGTADARQPVSAHDLDLRLVFARTEEGGTVDPSLLGGDPVLARGLETIEARRSRQFTRFDGNLAAQSVVDLSTRTLSPTSLERYAVCPFRWFLSDSLRLAELDRPEEARTISVVDRGTLVHAILERFIQEVIDEGSVPEGHKWTGDDHARIVALADETFDEFEHQMNVGQALAWQYEKQVVREELLLALDLDEKERLAHGVSPLLTEMPFGLGGEPPLEVTTRSGRMLRFRGQADRVDRGANGTLVVVDYKTGGASGYRPLQGEDPVVAGTKLQLPIYALAARARHGSPDDPVHAAYWFVSHRGGFVPLGFEVDDLVVERFYEAVDVIADGIEGGTFPAHSGEWDSWRGKHDNCRYCEFNRLCRTDRLESWDRKREAPELGAYVALVDPAEGDDV